MKKPILGVIALLGATLIGCTNYVPATYGPVEFETMLEGPFFASSVADAQFEFEFTPKDFGINAEDVHSMVMKEITISTT